MTRVENLNARQARGTSISSEIKTPCDEEIEQINKALQSGDITNYADWVASQGEQLRSTVTRQDLEARLRNLESHRDAHIKRKSGADI